MTSIQGSTTSSTASATRAAASAAPPPAPPAAEPKEAQRPAQKAATYKKGTTTTAKDVRRMQKPAACGPTLRAGALAQAAASGADPERAIKALGNHASANGSKGANEKAAAQKAEAVTARPAPSLKATTIKVHGHDVKVEYDPKKTSDHDIEVVRQGLQKYPKKWMDGVNARAKKNGEPPLTVRMVGRDSLPKEERGVDGSYDKQTNVLNLNMDTMADFASDKTNFRKDMQKLSKDAFLQRTVIHEFAHHADDAGDKGAGGLDGRTTDSGAFKGEVQGRSLERDRKDSVSAYDHQKGNAQHETFAEVVTRVVAEGDSARKELLANPRTRDLATRAIAYMDSGCDPRELRVQGQATLDQNKKAAVARMRGQLKQIEGTIGYKTTASRDKDLEQAHETLQDTIKRVEGMGTGSIDERAATERGLDDDVKAVTDYAQGVIDGDE